ncbi:MAG: SDR family oxidoreductase, partial [bacterium]
SAVAEALCARGDAATAIALDVTDTTAMAQLISEQGPFQILVNNAGTNRPAPCIDYTEADYDDVMTLNVRSVYFTTRAVARGLVAANLEGSIINISSQMGHVGGPGRTVYCASKHALEGFTKALAWELGEGGIRVNTLCPTFIATPMTEPMLEDETFKERVVSQIALGRVGQVEDLMGAIVYLASDASRLVTGSALMVDGGWTAV